jgi:transcriptional regulator with XRE-family HTH domain
MNEKEMLKSRRRRGSASIPQPATRLITLRVSTEGSKGAEIGENHSTTQSKQGGSGSLATNLLEVASAEQGISEGQNPLRQLAEKIRTGRKRRGLTQQQLADALGMHISFIAHLETLKDNGALPGYQRTSALERELEFERHELWELVEKARILMEWRRTRLVEALKKTELQRYGIDVPSAEKDHKVELSKEVSPEQLIEMFDNMIKVANDPVRRERMISSLREQAAEIESQAATYAGDRMSKGKVDDQTKA